MSVDALIVGAGPAGSAAAWVLRQAGWEVQLLEASAEARPKVGESLPAASVRLLRRLGLRGLSQLLAPGEYKACTANASAWGSERWEYRDGLRDPEGLGWHVARHRFDAALRRHAVDVGVQLTRGRACGVERGASGCAVHMEGTPRPIAARWVVDATGRRATVSRQLGAQRRRESTQLALYTWVPSPREDRDDTTRVKSVGKGWWYTARLPEQRRIIAFHGLPTEVSHLRKNPEEAWRRCLESGVLPTAVAEAFRWKVALQPSPARLLPFAHYRQPRPMSGWRVTDAGVVRSAAVAGSGWVAVGDAALAFDPLSSQGIFFALYSGVRAAEALLAPHEEPRGGHEPDLGARLADPGRHGAKHGASQGALAPALAAYSQRVLGVAAANRRARMLLYSQERRYAGSEYWQRVLTPY